MDLAVSNLNSDNVSIFLGNGNGTFGPATNFQVGDAPRSLTVGDFNGDTILDLATANQASNTVSILLGNGNGTFDAANNFPAGGIEPFDIAVGDFTSTTSTPPSIDNTDTLAIIKNKSCQPDSQICGQNISQPSDFTIFPIPSPFS